MSRLPDAHRSNSLPEAAAEDSRFTSPGAEQERECEDTEGAGEMGTESGIQAEPRALLPKQTDASARLLKQTKKPPQFLIRMPERTAGYRGALKAQYTTHTLLVGPYRYTHTNTTGKPI